MNIEDLREYCLSLPGACENSPWTVSRYQMLVTFTVGGKWFCLADIDRKAVNVKCDPADVDDLISRYIGITAAWHMNKRHWITVSLESDVPDKMIRHLLDNAYRLIVNKLTAKQRMESDLT